MGSPVVTISKEIELDAGHRIPNHTSKCRSPHGHRYTIVVYCEGHIITDPGASDEGMLVDYGDLKSLMMEKIHDVLDHGFIVWEKDKDLLDAFMWFDPAELPVESSRGMDPPWKIIRFPYIPTAENIAIWIWEQLVDEIKDRFRGDLWLHEVVVYETPTSTAHYQGEADASDS